MKAIVAAIHGILTNQTDPSWPDKFDAWMYERDPEVKVLKKEYRAGPFPRWNCRVKDPLLARSLANELEIFLNRSNTRAFRNPTFPPVWFVAHSNGAVIALLAAKRLIERGYQIGGLILTGAACEADIHKNQIFQWYGELRLGAAIAYCSQDDVVLSGDPRADTGWLAKARDWCWGKLMRPYGCLGRTGWLCHGKAMPRLQLPNIMRNAAAPARFTNLFSRWYGGGHSTYFAPENLVRTFEQIYEDIRDARAAHLGSPSAIVFQTPVPRGQNSRISDSRKFVHPPQSAATEDGCNSCPPHFSATHLFATTSFPSTLRSRTATEDGSLPSVKTHLSAINAYVFRPTRYSPDRRNRKLAALRRRYRIHGVAC